MNLTTVLPYKKQLATSRLLVWVGIASICMFFAGLTSAMIVIGKPKEFGAFQVPSIFLISSILLIVSSLIFQYGYSKFKAGSSNVLSVSVLLTLALGIGFIITQIIGWKELFNQGVVLAGKQSVAFGSFFYIVTLAHLLHLMGGIISLLVVLTKSIKKKYTPQNYAGVSVSIIYWHFLGVLWIYLYIFLFVLNQTN